METKDVTYRHIAKAICAHLPIEGAEFGKQVSQVLETINKLPVGQRYILKSAYIFSRKCPKQEREDVFQELVLKLLESKADSEGLCYAVARCDWKNWFAKYAIRQHYSLDVATDDDGHECTYADLLVGEVDWERRQIETLDAETIYCLFPTDIQNIITKRLIGKPTSGKERIKLMRHLQKLFGKPQDGESRRQQLEHYLQQRPQLMFRA